MYEVFLWLLPYFFLALAIAVFSGVTGTIIFMRNYSNLVGGIAHFVLGPIATSFFLEYFLGFDIHPFWFSVLVTSVVMFFIPLNENGRFKHEQHVNILWSFGMAVGVLLLHSTPNFTSLDSFLFGNLLAIARVDYYLFFILAALLGAFMICFHSRLAYLGLDDAFLRAKGIRTRVFHRLQLCILTFNLVFLLQSLGILLLLSVVSLPSIIAALYVKSYKELLFSSIAISAGVLLLSVLMSYLVNVPVSSFAAILLCVLFFIAKILTSFRGGGKQGGFS